MSPSDATEVDSGYGSSIETRKHNKSSAFTVWEEQLKPPGPSGTPKESTNPLPEQGPNNSRRSRHSVSNPPPPVAQPPSQPVGRSYHEKSSYDDPGKSNDFAFMLVWSENCHANSTPPPPTVARTTSRREGSRSRTMNERFPENSTQGGFTTILRSLTCNLWPASLNAEQDGYEPIPR
ncbi:hypothetical protein DXG01_008010 [Tephrocybe rancida]|nr:hypothetical protein DXG01_008010 [Tephrocybe rancida]